MKLRHCRCPDTHQSVSDLHSDHHRFRRFLRIVPDLNRNCHVSNDMYSIPYFILMFYYLCGPDCLILFARGLTSIGSWAFQSTFLTSAVVPRYSHTGAMQYISTNHDECMPLYVCYQVLWRPLEIVLSVIANIWLQSPSSSKLIIIFFPGIIVFVFV